MKVNISGLLFLLVVATASTEVDSDPGAGVGFRDLQIDDSDDNPTAYPSDNPTASPWVSPTLQPHGDNGDDSGCDDEDEDCVQAPTNAPSNSPTSQGSNNNVNDDEDCDNEGDNCDRAPTKAPSESPTSQGSNNDGNDDEDCDEDNNCNQAPTKAPSESPTTQGSNIDGNDDEDCDDEDEDCDQAPTKAPSESPTSQGSKNDGNDDEDCDDEDGDCDQAPTKAPSESPTNQGSINSGDGGDDATTVACFSGETLVTVQNQGLTKLKNLTVGQNILTPSGAYEKVYAFGHYQPKTVQEMLQITSTSSGAPLQVSKEHLLRIQDGSFVPAGSIQVGDQLTDAAVVASIRTINVTGLYAPLVVSGTFFVQGSQIVASSYVAVSKAPLEHVSHQQWVHFYLTPYRLFCLAASPKLCSVQYNNQETGIPHYIDLGIHLLDVVFHDSSSWILQGLFILVTVPLILVFVTIEQFLALSLVTKMLFASSAFAVGNFVSGTSTKKTVKVL